MGREDADVVRNNNNVKMLHSEIARVVDAIVEATECIEKLDDAQACDGCKCRGKRNADADEECRGTVENVGMMLIPMSDKNVSCKRRGKHLILVVLD